MRKKYLIVFIGYIVFCGCKSPVKKQGNKALRADTVSAVATKRQNRKPNFANPLLKSYESYLARLDTTQMESSTAATKKFIELFAKQDQNTCDSAFFIFSRYYAKLTNGFEDLPEKDTTIKYDSLFTDSGKANHPLSFKLIHYAEKMKANGFKIYMSEGDYYIGQDLNFVAKWFYAYVSPQMQEYLNQLNIENKEGFSEDAGLTINAVQFASRTVWWERFAAKYPNFIESVNANDNWKAYLGTLLEGMDNSPIFDFDKNAISDYYKTAYTYIQNNYPDSQTNKLVSPYFKLLLQKQNSKADKLIKQYAHDGKIL